MSINLRGMFLCSQAFMGRMISQRFGRIINVSSIWGLSGASCEVLYSTSKVALTLLRRPLRRSLPHQA